MSHEETADTPMDRRESIHAMAAMTAAIAVGPGRGTAVEGVLRIACFIRYQLDPFQLEAFTKYAEAWGTIIPRCGGHLIGYFTPHEGTNDVAWGLIAFEDLAAYERYRARIKSDPESRDNLATAQAKRFILREERTFVGLVDGTFERPSALRSG